MDQFYHSQEPEQPQTQYEPEQPQTQYEPEQPQVQYEPEQPQVQYQQPQYQPEQPQPQYQQYQYQKPQYQPEQQQPQYQYQQVQYQPPQLYQKPKKEKKDSNVYGLTSLILGVVSIFFFAICVNYITALIALIFGILQLTGCKKKGMAVVGITASVISVVLSVLLWGGVVYRVSQNPELFNPNGNAPNIKDYDSYEDYYKDYQDYIDKFFNGIEPSKPSGPENL